MCNGLIIDVYFGKRHLTGRVELQFIRGYKIFIRVQAWFNFLCIFLQASLSSGNKLHDGISVTDPYNIIPCNGLIINFYLGWVGMSPEGKYFFLRFQQGLI